jgi:hypothetical protein
LLSLLCSWRLDGLRAGQPGWDSRQGQDVSLIHNVETGSGAHPGSYPVSTGVLFLGVLKTFANYNYFYIIPYLISRVPSFLIESRATPGISASIEINIRPSIHPQMHSSNQSALILYTGSCYFLRYNLSRCQNMSRIITAF